MSGIFGLVPPRVRVLIATVATTAAANSRICGVMVSPAKAAASASAGDKRSTWPRDAKQPAAGPSTH